jgi:hypothetical protein
MKADGLALQISISLSDISDLRVTADSASNRGNDAGLCLGATRRRQPGGETQDIEQGFAAHVAQHDTKRESGDCRTEHHQHTYIDSHNGPLHQSFCSPIVRRVRTLVIDERLFARFIQCVIVTDQQPYVDPRFYCRIRYM